MSVHDHFEQFYLDFEQGLGHIASYRKYAPSNYENFEWLWQETYNELKFLSGRMGHEKQI